jgi:hypothetical protein
LLRPLLNGCKCSLVLISSSHDPTPVFVHYHGDMPAIRCCCCSARLLADDVRASVVGYLSVIRGVEGGMAKLGMGMVKHPALERAERLLRSAWRQVRLACIVWLKAAFYSVHRSARH